MPHTTEMITVAGARVRLLRGGPTEPGAPPLVFLHGAGGHTGWMTFLEELSQRFAVFAPEHPGFGQSDDPPWLDNVADLAYFYLDFLKALGLERVHLIGTSLGGWVAAEMAVRTSARLASLTLVGAVGITADGEPIPDIFRMPVEENLRRFYADHARAVQRARDVARADMNIVAKNRATVARLGGPRVGPRVRVCLRSFHARTPAHHLQGYPLQLAAALLRQRQGAREARLAWVFPLSGMEDAHCPVHGFILRDAAKTPLLRMRSTSSGYEILVPHGEERGDAARLEP